MHTVHKTPAVTVTAKATRDLAADLLLIPVFEDDQLADEIELTRASGGEYQAARSIESTSANSAGSSSAVEAPCRTRSARTRSRTRPCSSAIT